LASPTRHGHDGTNVVVVDLDLDSCL
jgi:hypothetical protein